MSLSVRLGTGERDGRGVRRNANSVNKVGRMRIVEDGGLGLRLRLVKRIARFGGSRVVRSGDRVRRCKTKLKRCHFRDLRRYPQGVLAAGMGRAAAPPLHPRFITG